MNDKKKIPQKLDLIVSSANNSVMSSPSANNAHAALKWVIFIMTARLVRYVITGYRCWKKKHNDTWEMRE